MLSVRSKKIHAAIVLASLLFLLVVFLFLPDEASAQMAQPNQGGADEGLGLPKITIDVGEGGEQQEAVSTLKILIILTVITLAPSIMITMTAFTRIVIVFFFLRQALGTQQSPPNTVLVSLALFLSLFVMQPVLEDIYDNAFIPFMNDNLSQEEALKTAAKPMRKFMLKQTRETDLGLFYSVTSRTKPNSPDDVPFHIVVPAFILSELKTAFQIGFLIYLPFLVLDMVIASVLMAMGMMMLPPIIISLPFKVMLFVLVDGWNLIAGQLIKSFG